MAGVMRSLDIHAVNLMREDLGDLVDSKNTGSILLSREQSLLFFVKVVKMRLSFIFWTPVNFIQTIATDGLDSIILKVKAPVETFSSPRKAAGQTK